MATTITPLMIAGGHVFNRDEDPVSGMAAQSVTCVGTVDVHELISSGAVNFVPDGGWMKIRSTLSAAPTTGAVLYQLDFGGEGATAGTRRAGNFVPTSPLCRRQTGSGSFKQSDALFGLAPYGFGRQENCPPSPC